MEVGRNSCTSWQENHPHFMAEGRQGVIGLEEERQPPRLSASGPRWMPADRVCAGTHPGRLGGYLVGDFIRKVSPGDSNL